jgi:SpoVK/Ycf46/Vps4 family AAA+-type ATPase
MPSPFLELFTGRRGRRAVDTITPERTFADVILPPTTRRTLEQALAQVRNHALIFERWGLGERHATGLGLAFNFAGPPGTGKTICAEAIAHALGKQLLVVNYAAVESMWAGETSKNVAAVFRTAGETDAVLFFDEADAIAARRTAGAKQAMEREANTVVNVLLRELETFNGVIIFATNLAANFDPAFERRIRTHVLFEMPGVEERERIWQVQLHPLHTPLSADVDFAALAAGYAASGGDIKNAVLKAAAAAASEPGPDVGKRIHQRHFVQGIEDVMAAKSVMRQSIFDEPQPTLPALPGATAAGMPTVGMPPRGSEQQQLALALQTIEARAQRTALVGIALGGAALLAGVGSLVVLALR